MANSKNRQRETPTLSLIHIYDNGILGAATLPDAEERRIRQLKEAGFNAIRSSHHPAGRALLDFPPVTVEIAAMRHAPRLEVQLSLIHICQLFKKKN